MLGGCFAETAVRAGNAPSGGVFFERFFPTLAGEKGGTSVYGLDSFPVTLYQEQWQKLLAMAERIEHFIEENRGRLKGEGE
jgi:hypothetical protein